MTKNEDDSQYAVQIIIGSVRYSDSSVGRWNLKRSSRCAGKLPESLPSIELRSKDLFKMSSFWNKDNHVLFSSVHTKHASFVVSYIACLSLFCSFAFVYWGFVLVIKTGSDRVFFCCFIWNLNEKRLLRAVQNNNIALGILKLSLQQNSIWAHPDLKSKVLHWSICNLSKSLQISQLYFCLNLIKAKFHPVQICLWSLTENQ